MFTFPLDDIDDEFKLKMAETLVLMFGDEILMNYYQEKTTMPKLVKIEKMLEEILYEANSKEKRLLTDGDMFGEQAALRDGYRSASVRTIEDCHLAYLEKEDFDHLYKVHMKAKVDRGIQFLRTIPLFSSLSKHFV